METRENATHHVVGPYAGAKDRWLAAEPFSVLCFLGFATRKDNSCQRHGKPQALGLALHSYFSVDYLKVYVFESLQRSFYLGFIPLIEIPLLWADGASCWWTIRRHCSCGALWKKSQVGSLI